MPRYCPPCGGALAVGARFCRQCYATVESLESPATESLESKSTPAVSQPPLVYEQVGEREAALEAYRECTAGLYAGVARSHVKRLEKKRRRSK